MTRRFATDDVSVPQTRIGHPVDRHARGARPHRGDDEVRRAHRRRDAEEDHPQRVEIDIRTGIVLSVCIGHVVEPAVIRRVTHKEARIDEQAGEQIKPVRKRVHARQRRVARAEQKRPEIIAESGQHRHGIEEDHRHAMHREQLVVLLRREHMQVGLRQLHAQDQRLDSADQQEDERCDDVANADLFMIDGAEKAFDPGLGLPHFVQALGKFRIGGDDRRCLRELRVSRHVSRASGGTCGSR